MWSASSWEKTNDCGCRRTTSDLILDPYDYDFHEDPYPYYKRLRDEAPLYRNDELEFWALSRHGDVLQGFRNSTTLSNKYGVSLDPISRDRDAHKTMSFLAMDDPAHLRLRTLVSKGFTPRRIRELEPRVTEIAVQHLDTACAVGHRSTTSTSSQASCRWTSSPNSWACPSRTAPASARWPTASCTARTASPTCRLRRSRPRPT